MPQDEDKLAKVHAAMAAAAKAAAGLTPEDAMQFLADYLSRHPDPDVRAFQARHEREHRRDLN